MHEHESCTNFSRFICHFTAIAVKWQGVPIICILSIPIIKWLSSIAYFVFFRYNPGQEENLGRGTPATEGVVELSRAAEPAFAYEAVRMGRQEQYDLTRGGLVAAIAAPEQQPFAISVKLGRFQAYARCKVPLSIRVTEARDDGSYPEAAVLEFKALELDEGVVTVMEAALRLAVEGKRGFGIMDITRRVRSTGAKSHHSIIATTKRVRGRRTRGPCRVQKPCRVEAA
jgi:hypothetical protein